MEAISKHPPVKSRQEVINVLSDQTGKDYRIYQEFGSDDEIKTIATGMPTLGSRIFIFFIYFIYLLFLFLFSQKLIVGIWLYEL